MNPLTQVRQMVADCLNAAQLGVTVHTYQPASPPVGPAVVLVPGETWLTPRGHVAIDVRLYATSTSTQGAQARLEQLAWDVQQALAAQGQLSWGELGKPEYDSTSQLSWATITTITRLGKGTP